MLWQQHWHAVTDGPSHFSKHPCTAVQSAGSTGSRLSHNSHCHHSPPTSSVSTFNQWNRNKHSLCSEEHGSAQLRKQNLPGYLHLGEPKGKASILVRLPAWAHFPQWGEFLSKLICILRCHPSTTRFSVDFSKHRCSLSGHQPCPHTPGNLNELWKAGGFGVDYSSAS